MAKIFSLENTDNFNIIEIDNGNGDTHYYFGAHYINFGEMVEIQYNGMPLCKVTIHQIANKIITDGNGTIHNYLCSMIDESCKEYFEIVKSLNTDRVEKDKSLICDAIEFQYSEFIYYEERRIKYAQTLKSQKASSSSSKDC